MGCRKILFHEAGPSRENTACSRTPARQGMQYMVDAEDMQNSEVPERSPCGSEPSEPRGVGTVDPCINFPEVVDCSSGGFRTPTATARQEGRRDTIAITTGSQGVVFSPPATLNTAEMDATEEELPPQTHKESMDPALIPMEGMSFHSEAEAREFFGRYAQLAGFGVRMGNKKTFSRVMRCSCEGKGEYYKGKEMRISKSGTRIGNERASSVENESGRRGRKLTPVVRPPHDHHYPEWVNGRGKTGEKNRRARPD